MKVKVVAPPHAGAIWWERLGSAFRTAIACTIIGCTALYAPNPIRQQIAYPSVAYVTTILIVSDATLGTTLRGFWHALCATMLVVPSTILCLWMVGPGRFTEIGSAVAVTLSAFLVSVPKCLPILAKQIGYVQLVIIYVGAVVRGHDAGPVTHPVHIAACTALGATASVLALMLPYPRLAVTEVKKQFQVHTENASERARLYMKAFLSEDKAIADDLISQAQPISKSVTKILNHINSIQEGVKWERYRVRDFKSSFVKTKNRLDDMETSIKGMEMALNAIPSFPLDIINEDLKTDLQIPRVKLEQAKCFVPFDQLFGKSLNSLASISSSHKTLPYLFFLSCFELLVNNTNMNPKPESVNVQNINVTEESSRPKMTKWGSKRLVFALKCSISLGLAVLLGMFFDKKNGYWSGLTIAISFVEGRQPVFAVANYRLQGTVIGTVYGIIGSILLNQVGEIRFIILLPWIVFTSLLQHSNMFGKSGGITAVLGALLILGRKNYGPPKQFAIARLTEVSIGLFCMVLLEVRIQPVRPATLVKLQVSRCLETLDGCLIRVGSLKENMGSNLLSLKETIKRLKFNIDELKKLIKDAKIEPSFLFLPFNGSCYDNVQEKLSNMVVLMQIMIYNMEFIAILSQNPNDFWKKVQELINGELEVLNENISPCLKRLQHMTLDKSIDDIDHHLQDKEGFLDLESAESANTISDNICVSKEASIMEAFGKQIKEVSDKIQGDEECKGKGIMHLNSLGFCIGNLMGETIEVEKSVKDIIRCENRSPKVDYD